MGNADLAAARELLIVFVAARRRRKVLSIRDRAVAAVRGRSSNGKRQAFGAVHSSPRTGGKSQAQFRASGPKAKFKHGAAGIIHRELPRANPGGLGVLPMNNSATPIRSGICQTWRTPACRFGFRSSPLKISPTTPCLLARAQRGFKEIPLLPELRKKGIRER